MSKSNQAKIEQLTTALNHLALQASKLGEWDDRTAISLQYQQLADELYCLKAMA